MFIFRRGLSLAFFAVAAFGVHPLRAAPVPVWRQEGSARCRALHAVSCPSAAMRVAIGEAGVIVESINGGRSWQQVHGQRSGGAFNSVDRLDGIACPTVRDCYAEAGPDRPQPRTMAAAPGMIRGLCLCGHRADRRLALCTGWRAQPHSSAWPSATISRPVGGSSLLVEMRPPAGHRAARSAPGR